MVHENIDALQKLLSSGLTHQTYSDGRGRWTPLALACHNGYAEVVRTLLETYGSQIIPAKGLRKFLGYHGGHGRISEIAISGHLGAFKLLVETGISAEYKKDALMRVIGTAPFPNIQYMVSEAGFNTEYKNTPTSATTPLAAAAQAGQCDVFKFLIEFGVWPNPVTDLRTCFDKYAPLFRAAVCNNKEVVRFLLDGPALTLLGRPGADDAADLAISAIVFPGEHVMFAKY